MMLNSDFLQTMLQFLKINVLMVACVIGSRTEFPQLRKVLVAPLPKVED
jgi:spore coat protein CotF